MEGKGFLKQKTNRIGQKIIAIFIIAVMFMVDLAPLSQVRADENEFTYYEENWVNLTSNNRNLLEVLGKAVRPKVSYFIFYYMKKGNKNVELSSAQEQAIEEPYLENGKWNIRIPEMYLMFSTDKADCNITSVDFSGVYLGDQFTLPDFSIFKSLRELKFDGCSISNLQPFEDAFNKGYLKNVTSIHMNDLSASLKNKVNNYNFFRTLVGSDSYSFQPGNTYDPTTNIDRVIKVTYDPNGGTGGPGVLYHEKGKQQISYDEPTREGYTFKGWTMKRNVLNKKKDGTEWLAKPGDVIYITSSKGEYTRYAYWVKNEDSNIDIPGSDNIPDGDNNTAISGSDEETTTITTITTTTTTWYYWEGSMNFSGNSSISKADEFSKKKTITLNAEVSGLIAENVAPDVNDCIMMVNGERVQNNNGTGTYEVTKNGTYTVRIGYPTYDQKDWYECEYHVGNIDNERPSIEFVENYPTKDVQHGGEICKILTVKAIDNNELKYLKIVDPDTTYEISGTDYSRTFQVNNSGEYTFRVIDAAGNECTVSKNIIVDEYEPKVLDCKVEKINGTKNGNINYIATKSGEKLKVKLTCNDNDSNGIRSIGAAGKEGKEIVQLSTGEVIDDAIENLKIDSKTIEFDVDINKVQEITENKAFFININGISDYSNNYIEYYQIPEKIVIDNTKPQIVKFEIKGGTRSTDEKAVMLVPGEKLTFDLTVSEKLGEKPYIEIAGKKYELEYNRVLKQKVNENNSESYTERTYYIYSVTVESNSIQVTSDGVVPITLKNLVDYSGNIAENSDTGITYNKENKTTGQMLYLYKGVYSTDSLYIVAVKNDKDIRPKGDINNDGYVTTYDLIEMQKLIIENTNSQNSEILKIADINEDGVLTHQDWYELNKIVASSRNRIFEGIATEQNPKQFMVFTKDSEENLKGSNIEWSVTDKDGNAINNNINYNSNTGIFSLYFDDGAIVQKITIKVKRNTANEEEYGELKLYSGRNSNAGIKIASQDSQTKAYEFKNRTGHNIIGDVNGDGYVTTYDAIVVQRMSVGLGDNESWTDKLADWDGDGDITTNDALLLLRKDINLGSVDGFHAIQKGESIDLHFAYIDDASNLVEDPAGEWSVTILKGTKEGQNASFVRTENNDGSIRIKANGEIGDRAVITVEGTDMSSGEAVTKRSVIYLEIGDLDISLNKYELQFDINSESGRVPQELYAQVNIENKAINVVSQDENIAKIEIDDFGKVKVTPVGVGSTTINFICEGKTVVCKLDVLNSISEIRIEPDMDSVTLKEGETTEFSVITNGIGQIEYNSSDDKIAKIIYDENRQKYIIKGINPGEATIVVYSASNPMIKKEIRVTVEKISAPKLISYTASEGCFKAGSKISLEFSFDSELSGSQPELSLRFGNEPSKNKAEYVTISSDLKKITYNYTVAEGDNGVLMIEKIGTGLKDSTKTLDAIVTFNNASENAKDGIYEICTGTVADTIKPTIVLDTKSSKHWLKDGDDISVIVVSEKSDKLVDIPKVYFNNIEANVEKYGTGNYAFIATLKVTDEIKEGYVEIVVDDYQDIAGNKGERLVANKSNMENAILIDKTAPKTLVTVYTPRAEGEKYVAGDEINIELSFIDETRGGADYIRAEKAPEINLVFGNKNAQGVLTNNYITENGPVTRIFYKYKVSDKDEGEFKIQSVTGHIEDMAGNETDIDIKQSDVTTNPKDDTTSKEQKDKTDKSKDDTTAKDQIDKLIDDLLKEDKKESLNDDINSTSKGKVSSYSGALPYTGIQTIGYMIIGLILFDLGIAVYFINKKRKI